jgi:hypothetical protein
MNDIDLINKALIDIRKEIKVWKNNRGFISCPKCYEKLYYTVINLDIIDGNPYLTRRNKILIKCSTKNCLEYEDE